ncbi:MAG: hypothetical protein V4629_09750 [Pseudomonadota bacterium]
MKKLFIKPSFKKLAVLTLGTVITTSAVYYKQVSLSQFSPIADSTSVISITNNQSIESDSHNLEKIFSNTAAFNISHTANQNNLKIQSIESAWKMSNIAHDLIEMPKPGIANTTQIIQLNENFMVQEYLTMRLPNGKNLQMKKSDAAAYASGLRSWSGFDPEHPEVFAAITKNGNEIAGSVETLDGTFEIATLKDGTQFIYQLNKKIQQTHNSLPSPKYISPSTFT